MRILLLLVVAFVIGCGDEDFQEVGIIGCWESVNLPTSTWIWCYEGDGVGTFVSFPIDAYPGCLPSGYFLEFPTTYVAEGSNIVETTYVTEGVAVVFREQYDLFPGDSLRLVSLLEGVDRPLRPDTVWYKPIPPLELCP